MPSRRDMSHGKRPDSDGGHDDADTQVPVRRRRDPNAGITRDGARGGSSSKSGAKPSEKLGGKPSRGGPTRLRGPLGEEQVRSDRPLQVAGEIRRAVQAEISRGLNDPRVQGMVSVTEVEVLPDFSEARVKVSVLPEQKAPLTLSGLRAAAGFLRRRVMDDTRIGRVPRLVFEVDERFKRETALDAVIRAASATSETAAQEDKTR
ncbi:MAG: 30S ribosome-binding factor RbfA [bacterium]